MVLQLMGALIIVAAVALDWALTFLVWQGFQRIATPTLSPRVSDVMPWALVQVFILVGLLVTGALGETNNGAILLTGIPIAVLAAFFAVPVALFKARGARKVEWRICLDHTYATAAVWAVALAIGLFV
ncbi:MAG: hypothetical protein ACRDJ2_04500 [Actinomycetota bacterium]